MKKVTRMGTGLIVMALAGVSSANMIINSSFENNSAGVTLYNMTNAEVGIQLSGIEGFGSANEIDLMQTGQLYGGDPTDGSWKLGMHTQIDGFVDAFTFSLTDDIIAGQSYTLRFMAQVVENFDPGPGGIEVGTTDTAGTFGALAYTATVVSTDWTEYATTFTAGANASFLSVQSDVNRRGAWTHIDQFSLDAVPEPATFVVTGAGALALALRRRRAR